jgi:fibro-slime domain-containing protein
MMFRSGSSDPVRVWPLVLGLLEMVTASCGARTGLYDCFAQDETRACSNACGEGTQICDHGAWQACDVAPTLVPCVNDCGKGEQRCIRGELGVCEVARVTRGCSTLCGTGVETCDNGQWHGCTAPKPKTPRINMRVRDFHSTHPDMEHALGDDRGLVADVLGADDKPVYLPSGPTATTTGKASFDQWYRDVDGVNLATEQQLTLSSDPQQPEVWAYSNADFFPIDDQLFGNEGNSHNYHFTVEIAATFRYSGGETFSFSGDDDVFVFINRRLVIDLGGVHGAESATVALDAVSAQAGISAGNIYPMHIFFAERHTVASDFLLETTIGELGVCY